MTLYWKDSLARANQSGFGTADSGGTYAVVRSNQALSITSNEGLMTFNGSTSAGVVQAGSQVIGDSEMLCRVSQGGSTTDLVGVVPRFITVDNWYCFVIGDTAGQFQFIKDVATSFSVVASFAFTTTVGSFYWIRTRVQGTHFLGKIWADGSAEPNTWGIDTTDSALGATGTFGLTCAPQNGNNVKVDSFYVVDYLNCENLTVTDSFQSTDTGVFVDSSSASDSFGGSGGSGVFTEGLIASDSLLAQDSYSTTDGLSALDAFLSQGGAQWVEINPSADGFSGGGTYLPIEVVAVFDNLLESSNFLPVELLSAQDMQSSLQSWGVDLLVISDGFTTITTFIPVEALNAFDKLLANDQASWVDLLSVSDLFTGQSTTPVQGSVALTTVIARGRDGLVIARSRDGIVIGRGR